MCSGMYVEVGFVAGSQPSLVIPLSTVVLRSEVVGVYVVDAEGRCTCVTSASARPPGRSTSA